MISSEAAGQALEARVTRATRESGEMRWTKTSGGWAVQTASGGLYLVTASSCSCPDFAYRGPRTGACKHTVALGHMLIEKGIL